MTDVPVGRNLWSMGGSGDTVGLGDATGLEDTAEPDLIQEFKESVTYDDGRYVVKLPWRSDGLVSKLSDNREAAEARLSSLSRKLDGNPLLRERYDCALREMETSGVICEVPTEEMCSEFPVYYMPHRPVVKETSRGMKVRPVFDASARGYNGLSLNDCVELGPALIPSLPEVLLRFRRWRFGFSADIVKAFLQVRLAREDQDVHRFLWLCEGRVRVMRFQRVTFGVACSPFLLNATVQHHLSQYGDEPVVQEMKENFYMDDLLSGADSEAEVVAMFREARSIMGAAGMELSKCSSNSAVLFGELEGGSVSDSVKVLGVTWWPDDDTFSFVGQLLPDDVVPTKRVLLSLIARLFDPLGFLTPFTMLAKCLFQDLWEQGSGWDEPLRGGDAELFRSWVDGLQLLQRHRIPRCYSAGGGPDWSSDARKELHVFADASPKGYGAVVYIRLSLPDGSSSVSMVMSKARVAPLKRQTLPRLELMACLMASQLVELVRKALRLPDGALCTCWSDSMIALGWLTGDPRRWKPFVASRVRQIQSLTPVACWRHCSSSDNPADLLTRGMLADDLLVSRLWRSGPDWLRVAAQPLQVSDGTASWVDASESAQLLIREEMVAVSGEPAREVGDLRGVLCDARVQTVLSEDAAAPCAPTDVGEGKLLCSDDAVAADGAPDPRVSPPPDGGVGAAAPPRADGPSDRASVQTRLLDLDRFGSLNKATRVMGWVQRFVRNARGVNRCSEQDLTCAEMTDARNALFRLVQVESFHAEMTALRMGGRVPASSPLHRLSPFLSDGLLRVQGRLQFSQLSYEEKHPIILPKGHLSYLLVREQHHLMHHAGVATLLTAVRSEFWVLGLRAIARRVVRSCLACRWQDARAGSQQTAPLPRDRVSPAPPFSVTGVDFAGPLFSVDFPRKKLYVCLFTCAVTRAVHLELTESLSLPHFMLAFRRFAARRGVPSTVYSDNATTFKGADVQLRKYFGRLSPCWKFIAPLSPWWGGWWERLIRSVKVALRKSLGKRCLTRIELETVLSEVEACINSRPLTFQGDTPDCPGPLTPNHFLTGRSVGFQARAAEDPSAVTARALSDRARVCEMRLSKFWAAWRNEYLRTLPPAVSGKGQGKLEVGSPVLVHEEGTPRLKWDMGVVTRVFSGRDGLVRSAEVRTPGGLRTRSVQRLHNLEVLPSSLPSPGCPA
ncbi:uncharacterized protein LOC122391301 isoform X1 [Amphibalanus amphitrite]|uniref:uncharacterized protein LOC122391301 isoform X1 n=1 Tax=Amphibalanus amphitrite TaxID=1232801 RepID=UPI001C902AC6|nr:uncharacterized protein LOC122391301 isoform X1 [Amphibalanus amphitrite]